VAGSLEYVTSNAAEIIDGNARIELTEGLHPLRTQI
jgi:hypothetical protein